MKKFWKCAASVFAAVVLMLTGALAGCTGDGELGTLQSIHIVESGLNTTYRVGETFDYGAVRIRAVYSEGEKQLTGTSEGVTHTDLDMERAGKQTLTFTYRQKSDSVEIEIVEIVDVLESLSVGAVRTAYTVGETFDYGSVPLVAHYTTRDVDLTGASEGVTHTTLDMTKTGEQTLTFTYGGKSASIKITISEAAAEKTLNRIEIAVTDPAKLIYTQGDVVDYSVFSLKLYFSNGETETRALTAEGVSYAPVDTSSAGEKTFTVQYGGLEASVTLTVNPPAVTVMSFELPTAYELFLRRDAETPAAETREDTDHLLAAAGTYRVGDDNGFRFMPAVRGYVGDSKDPTVVAVKTTCKLSVQGDDGTFSEVEEADLAAYMTTVEGKADIYFFHEAALGKTFELAVSLAEDVKTSGSVNRTVKIVFEVVDGYNVYDDLGLSVFDNLNVKHWKDVKEAAGTLAWDTKPLKDYNNLETGEIVKEIVLHESITIDPDDLPATYFWDEARASQQAAFASVQAQLRGEGATNAKQYAEKLNGSLRDYDSEGNRAHNFNSASEGDVAEIYPASRVNMQKALYNNVGTNISGNGMLVTYEDPATSDSVRKLWSVRDDRETPSSNPVGHWSFFKYVDEEVVADAYPALRDGDGYKFSTTPRVESLRVKGYMPRLSQTDGELPQLMAFNNAMDSLDLVNCLVSQVYVVVICDEAHNTSAVNTTDTKAFDVYSNMFYVWRSDVNVQNCVMKDAGGPIFLLSDGEFHRNGTDKLNDEEGPHLFFDEASILVSKAAGTEPWYKLNNADVLFSGIKMLNAATKGYLNRTMTSTENGIEVVNVIAALICSPGELSNTQDNIAVRGYIKRGESETYALNPSTGNDLMDNTYYRPLIESAAPIFFSNQIFAAYVQGAAEPMGFPGDMLCKTEDRFTSNAADIRAAWDRSANEFIFLTLRASALGPTPSAAAPRFGVLIGGCSKVQ